MPSDKRLAILHVIPSLSASRGGPSRAALEMVRALQTHGVEAKIVCTNDDGNKTLDVPTGRFIDYQGVPVRFFKRYSPKIQSLREFAYASDFSQWLKANIQDFDALHVHAIFSYCTTVAMKIARAHKTPYIVRPIGQLQTWSLEQSALKKKVYLALVEQKNIEQAALVHCTSKLEFEQTSKSIPNLTSQTIPLGTQIPQVLKNARTIIIDRYGLDAKQPIIISLSRLHPKKGIELLLKGLSINQNKPWQLLIAGYGEPSYLAKLKEFSNELNISHRCHFISYIDGDCKTNALQGADLFALSSYSENFGISVIEAMACGTAPLVSKEVGVCDLILENDLGYVCQTNPDSIAQTLNTALDCPKILKHKSLAAKHYVKSNFSWDAITPRLIDIYQSIRK